MKRLRVLIPLIVLIILVSRFFPVTCTPECLAQMNSEIFFLITPDHSLTVWGADEGGVYGGSHLPMTWRPYLMRKTILRNVRSVAPEYVTDGSGRVMAVDLDGGLWYWGNTECILTGGICRSPTKVLEGVRSVQMDVLCTRILMEDGTLQEWSSTPENRTSHKVVAEHVLKFCGRYMIDEENRLWDMEENVLIAEDTAEVSDMPPWPFTGAAFLTTSGEYCIYNQETGSILEKKIPHVRQLIRSGFVSEDGGLYRCESDGDSYEPVRKQSGILWAASEDYTISTRGVIRVNPVVPGLAYGMYQLSSTTFRNISVILVLCAGVWDLVSLVRTHRRRRQRQRNPEGHIFD